MRKYRRKAHTSGLHRDINLCANFPRPRRLQKPHDEREAEQAHRQGARPPLLANQHESHGLYSTAFEDQGKPFNQGQFDPMAQIH